MSTVVLQIRDIIGPMLLQVHQQVLIQLVARRNVQVKVLANIIQAMVVPARQVVIVQLVPIRLLVSIGTAITGQSAQQAVRKQPVLTTLSVTIGQLMVEQVQAVVQMHNVPIRKLVNTLRATAAQVQAVVPKVIVPIHGQVNIGRTAGTTAQPVHQAIVATANQKVIIIADTVEQVPLLAQRQNVQTQQSVSTIHPLQQRIAEAVT